MLREYARRTLATHQSERKKFEIKGGGNPALLSADVLEGDFRLGELLTVPKGRQVLVDGHMRVGKNRTVSVRLGYASFRQDLSVELLDVATTPMNVRMPKDSGAVKLLPSCTGRQALSSDAELERIQAENLARDERAPAVVQEAAWESYLHLRKERDELDEMIARQVALTSADLNILLSRRGFTFHDVRGLWFTAATTRPLTVSA